MPLIYIVAYHACACHAHSMHACHALVMHTCYAHAIHTCHAHTVAPVGMHVVTTCCCHRAVCRWLRYLDMPLSRIAAVQDRLEYAGQRAPSNAGYMQPAPGARMSYDLWSIQEKMKAWRARCNSFSEIWRVLHPLHPRDLVRVCVLVYA